MVVGFNINDFLHCPKNHGRIKGLFLKNHIMRMVYFIFHLIDIALSFSFNIYYIFTIYVCRTCMFMYFVADDACASVEERNRETYYPFKVIFIYMMVLNKLCYLIKFNLLNSHNFILRLQVKRSNYVELDFV